MRTIPATTAPCGDHAMGTNHVHDRVGSATSTKASSLGARCGAPSRSPAGVNGTNADGKLACPNRCGICPRTTTKNRRRCPNRWGPHIHDKYAYFSGICFQDLVAASHVCMPRPVHTGNIHGANANAQRKTIIIMITKGIRITTAMM